MTLGVLEAAAWAPAERRGGPHERPTRRLCDAVAAPGSSPAAPEWEVLKGHRPLAAGLDAAGGPRPRRARSRGRPAPGPARRAAHLNGWVPPLPMAPSAADTVPSMATHFSSGLHLRHFSRRYLSDTPVELADVDAMNDGICSRWNSRIARPATCGCSGTSRRVSSPRSSRWSPSSTATGACTPGTAAAAGRAAAMTPSRSRLHPQGAAVPLPLPRRLPGPVTLPGLAARRPWRVAVLAPRPRRVVPA